MWQAQTNRPSHLVGCTAAAVLATTAAQCLGSPGSSQLASEALGWALLPVLAKFVKWPSRSSAPRSVNLPPKNDVGLGVVGSCWALAVAMATATFASSENRFATFLLPTLTPALLLIQEQPRQQLPSLSKTKVPSASTSFAITGSGAVIISILGIYALACWSLPSFLYSLVELLALLVIFGAVLPKLAPKYDTLPQMSFQVDFVSISWRVSAASFAALLPQTLIFGFAAFDVTTMLLASVTHAFSWLFIFEMARHTSWISAAAIKIFTLFATISPFIQTFERQALLHIICSSLALGQVITLIPQQVANRRLLWALLLIPILPYFANMSAIRAAHSRAINFSSVYEHPIETIIQRANSDFETMLSNQSKSYLAACDEYRRRYKMEPPPGFEQWFSYATAHHSKIIDDFDILYESIRPLSALSGTQITRAMEDLQRSIGSEVWTCTFTGRTGLTECTHPRRSFDRHLSELLNRLMGDVKNVLPDVKFLVNHLDEPRVMFPARKNSQDPPLDIDLKILSHSATWSSLVNNCQASQHDRLDKHHQNVNSFGVPFVQNKLSSQDLCKHAEYEHIHGMLVSPTSFPLISGMVPVLSTGSMSTMGDILFPSPAYNESEFIYDDNHDPIWSKKTNNLYWAGSTSGAFATGPEWRSLHRQRFVDLAQMLDGREYSYLAEKHGVAKRVTSSFLNSRLFDVSFTKVYQCAKAPCREQSLHYRMKAWADRHKALHSRLTFDIDGNGISGRWYRMIASRSAPLKQSLLREWHDDRLLPWVHYIPVSMGMEELPELVTYLTSTKRGQKKAEEIAERGRLWFSQALRGDDMTVYVYRLLLELARLQDPQRSAVSAS